MDPIAGFSMADMPVTETAMPLSFESGAEPTTPKGGFMDVLQEALGEVQAATDASKQITDDALLGKSVDIHEIMIAGAKAEVMTQLTSAVTNKVAQAYQTLANMQV